MSDNGKFVTGLLLGAAAAAALGYFFTTDKGKKVVGDLKDIAGKAGDNLKDAVSNLEKEVNNVVEKGKQYAEDLEAKAKNVTT